jgi:hypothetical protein
MVVQLDELVEVIADGENPVYFLFYQQSTRYIMIFCYKVMCMVDKLNFRSILQVAGNGGFV